MTVAWVGVGAAVLGAGASIYAGNKSASAVRGAANSATGEQAREFDQIRSDTAAARSLGQGAIGMLGRLYGIPVTGLPGGTPEQTVGTGAFKPSDIVGMLQRGMSIDDILKLGTLTPNQGAKEFRYLQANGLNPEQINQLIQGRFSPSTTPTSGTPATTPDMSVFTASPDYQFNLSQGQQAIDRSLASRGLALSGAGVKAGERFASGLASTEFGNFYNRLANLAGLGQSATNTSATAGLTTAGNIGANIMNAGNARASAYGNTGATIGNVANGLASNYLLYQYLNPRTPAPAYSTTYAPSVNSGIVGPRD